MAKTLVEISAMGLVGVEFKVKTSTLTWEQTGVYTTVGVENLAEASYKAQEVADYEGVEVRWNIKGLHQGHCVQPKEGGK